MDIAQLWSGLIGAVIGGALAAIPAVPAWITAKKANRIAAQALDESRRVREIEEANQHRALTPELRLEVGAKIGSGYELIVTSTSIPVDAITVSLVRGVYTTTADRAVVALSDRPAQDPVGSISDTATTPPLGAGEAATLGLWVTDADTASGAHVRFRCEARRGDQVWPDLMHEVSLPVRIPAPPKHSPRPARGRG